MSPTVAVSNRRSWWGVELEALPMSIIDTGAASPELRAVAIDILGLEKIAESGGRELYRPRGTEITAPLQ